MLLGDLDLHLLGEGTHRRLWQALGATALDATPLAGVQHETRFGSATTRVAVWAPNARRVEVVGDWNDWQGEDLEPQGSSGVWAALTAARPGQCYKFRVTGADGRVLLKADPMARAAERPPSDASVVAAPSTHRWTDESWCSARTARHASDGQRGGSPVGTPLRIYEVHLGSWRADLTNYRDIALELARHVSGLGFTHVELLPIAEHPFGGSWGYQVTGYYAPTARFGGPDDFRAFVDILHAQGIGVILDWVPAHFPRDEWALARFDGTPLYEHGDPRRGEHPDWGTLVFDYGRNEVRNFLMANALYWFDEFHIDGLRVDAVASMLYLDYSREPGAWEPNTLGGREHLEAVDFLRQVTEAVRDEVPGALLIAEESTAWPGVSHPVADGGLGFTHKWNMGWMHDTLHYLAKDAVHRRWHHHELTFGLLYAFGERYVLPLSHDEVVHGKGSLLTKMAGDDWQRFASLRSLYAWMWALPGAPLVFMGAELAPWNEWSDAGSLPWHLLEHPAHRGVAETLRALNRAADEWPAVWERDDDPGGFEWLDADDAANSVYAFVRWAVDGAHAVVCIANFTPVPRPGYRVGLPWLGEWQVVIDSDAARCGGSGYRGEAPAITAEVARPWQGKPVSAQLDLPPLGVVWLAAHRPVGTP